MVLVEDHNVDFPFWGAVGVDFLAPGFVETSETEMQNGSGAKIRWIRGALRGVMDLGNGNQELPYCRKGKALKKV